MSDTHSHPSRPNVVGERLIRIETKIDLFLDQLKDHETRIRVLEAWRYWMLGAAAAAGAVGDKVVSLLPSVH